MYAFLYIYTHFCTPAVYKNTPISVHSTRQFLYDVIPCYAGCTSLDLSNNLLSEVPAGGFLPVAGLRSLSLSNNTIRVLGVSSFLYLTALTALWLDGNDLATSSVSRKTGQLVT